MDTKQIDHIVRTAFVPAAKKLGPVVGDATAPVAAKLRPIARARRRRRAMPFGPHAADASRLGLRLTFGGYLVGHGAQKLFGAFGGGGPRGTGEHFDEIGLKPGPAMSVLAGTTELLGGLLTTTGTLSPLGPLMAASTMVVAAGTEHRDQGAFAQTGGPELPLTNVAVAAVLAAGGPGRFSVDRLVGTRLPAPVAGAIVATGIGLAGALVVWSAIQRRAASGEDADRSSGSDADDAAPARAHPKPPVSARTG